MTANRVSTYGGAPTQLSILVAAAAFAWPCIVDLIGELGDGRRVAALASAMVAAGRYGVAFRAFHTQTRGSALRLLCLAAVLLSVASVIAVPFDVPSTLSSRNGGSALLSYALFRSVSATAYSFSFGVLLLPFMFDSAPGSQSAVPFLSAICAAAPTACVSLIAYSWYSYSTTDATWRMRVAYGVGVPLIAGLVVWLVGGVSDKLRRRQI